MTANETLPRPVRLSKTYFNKRNATVALTILFELIFLTCVGTSAMNTGDYLENGRKTEAVVASRELKSGKSPGFNLRLNYVAGGLSNVKTAFVKFDDGDKYQVGGRVTLLVRPEHPTEAWFGPLDPSNYENRIALLVAGLLTGAGIGAAVFSLIGKQSRDQLAILANWVFVDSKVKRIGQTPERSSSRAVTVTYDFRGYPYTLTFDCDEPIEVDNPITLLVNPDRPEKAVAANTIKYAEVVS